MEVRPIRVVVTSNDRQGRSYIDRDGWQPDVLVQPGRPTALTDIWRIAGVPTDSRRDGGAVLAPFSLGPARGGVNFRIVQFDPMSPEDWERLDSNAVFAAMNASSEHVGGAVSPVMHRTESVDFGIVLEGRITMLLDDGQVELSAGDVVVQRATSHAWENRGSASALVAFVLIDARDA